MSLPLASSLVVDRPPLTFGDLPRLAEAWVQEAGGFAAVGLGIYLGAYLLRIAPPLARTRWRPPLKALFILLLTGALGSYLTAAWLALSGGDSSIQGAALTLGGSCAVLAAGLPFVLDLAGLRGRRILALARLSIKEALHSKILWVFSGLLLLLLFVTWFVPPKPESQLRTYVQVLFWVMTLMIVFSAAILGAFGIPNDLRQHTIYSLVSKPVERFEIVLGRWLGYLAVMTFVLLLMTTVSLVYIWVNGVHPDSINETWKARVPLYGGLDFHGRPQEAGAPAPGAGAGIRRFLAGGTPARAVWSFHEFPSRLEERPTVPCEFSFDSYRTRKGEENKGVLASFTFESWRWHPVRKPDYDRELAAALAALDKPDHGALAAIHDRLAEKFGYYEFPSKEVFDYYTYAIDVPAGLFRNAHEGYRDLRQQTEAAGGKLPPPVRVTVKCEQAAQFLGMARHDLYLLDAEGWFAVNFYKGALGLWFRLCLVLGLAVACSTYLSGIVSLLASMFLYTAGLLAEYIRSIADKKSEVGGPAEGVYRMVNRMVPMAPLDETAPAQAAGAFDECFRWFLHRFLNVVPDVDRFDLTEHVAQGFDISATMLFFAVLLLVGYLLPWAVLACYSITAREVAA